MSISYSFFWDAVRIVHHFSCLAGSVDALQSHALNFDDHFVKVVVGQ